MLHVKQNSFHNCRQCQDSGANKINLMRFHVSELSLRNKSCRSASGQTRHDSSSSFIKSACTGNAFLAIFLRTFKHFLAIGFIHAINKSTSTMLRIRHNICSSRVRPHLTNVTTPIVIMVLSMEVWQGDVRLKTELKFY